MSLKEMIEEQEKCTEDKRKRINVGKLVVKMKIMGKTNKEIADELSIAESLVRSLIARNMR